MEVLMITACLTLMAMCCSVSLLAVILLLRRPDETPVRTVPAEEPQEQEAAEAQRRYEQGFFNLMQYDGRPGREKERENG